MINNFELIKDLLKFDSEDDFYHLQILKRKKENPELGANSAVIKTYYVRSVEYLDARRSEIISLASFTNARACINLNRRSFEKIAYHTLLKVTNQIMNKDYKSVRKCYESACGANSHEPDKKWLIDIDTRDEHVIAGVIDYIRPIEPVGEKVIAQIPTKNGVHLIVRPFDRSKAEMMRHEIHKDNPTILFIP